MSKVLQGKIAIVTGASSGIGLATVKAFLEAGASVLGVDLATSPEAVAQSETYVLHQVDLTETTAPSSIATAAKLAFPHSKRIDILVNCAGILDYSAGAANVDDATWEKVIAVNLTAPVRLTREVINVMKEQGGGNIVNVSSKAGQSGAVAGVAYTASKHALIGVTKNTAWLYKDDGIRCNAIAPGGVSTNISKAIDPAKVDLESAKRFKPVYDIHINQETGEGVLSPEVCAQAILFLASDLSTGITGAVVPVDNGFSTV